MANFSKDYATEGLRTLCLASRDISEAEYREFSVIYDQAAATINGRGEALDKAAEIIERDLFLLGATAIEDKLQEGVPDTIHTLQMAGIKVRRCSVSVVPGHSRCFVNAGVGSYRRQARDCDQHRHVVQAHLGVDELGMLEDSGACSIANRSFTLHRSS